MAKKSKEVKPFPTIAAILMLVIALAAMIAFVCYIIAPPTDEPHVDSLGEQSFGEESSVEPPPPVVEVKEYMSEANVGDAVTYGKYEQDGNIENGKENIEWIVLDKDAQGLLLISRNILDCKPFNETRSDVNWQESSLRAWLNGDFYANAFDNTEKNNIIETSNIIDMEDALLIDYPVDEVLLKDRVSILSVNMARNYYEYDSWRMALPTEYAVDQGVYTEDEYAWWWLRENIEELETPDAVADYVYVDGSIRDIGFSVDYDKVGVRPVIWVSLTAEKGETDDSLPESSETTETESQNQSE